jgi:hypothetical protein
MRQSSSFRSVLPGRAQAFARAALVVHEAPDRRVGQRRVADHQLARREVARVGAVGTRAAAKERDLKTQRALVGRFDPAGGIPPFGAKLGMGAVVARERQRRTGRDGGKHGRFGARWQRQQRQH